MPLVYITGPTGAGKSTVCVALAEKGFTTYDTDNKGWRQRSKNNTLDLIGAQVEGIYQEAAKEPIFLCGTSPNDMDFKHLFSKIILLGIDEDLQRQRIVERKNSEYGKQSHQLAAALKWREVQTRKYRNAGAVEIDTTDSIETVVEKIINLTH